MAPVVKVKAGSVALIWVPHTSLLAAVALDSGFCWLGEQGYVCVTGTNGLPGCSCGLHPERVEATKSCSEDPISGCNAGELQPLGVAG